MGEWNGVQLMVLRRRRGDREIVEVWMDGRFFFDFIQWKPTDTWPRDRCGRAQLVLLPSLADFLHLGADL